MNTFDGWSASDPAVGSVVIVVMYPRLVGGGVGPFEFEPAVESFDFAVRLGPLGGGVFVLESEADRGLERVRAVAGPVVSDHAQNAFARTQNTEAVSFFMSRPSVVR